MMCYPNTHTYDIYLYCKIYLFKEKLKFSICNMGKKFQAIEFFLTHICTLFIVHILDIKGTILSSTLHFFFRFCRGL